LSQRDKLLNFQSTSAKRTRVIDQVADFETPESGLNMWATPQERALQLRAQQKKMREVEWANKADWEKRKVVMAIDLKGRKVVREMQAIETPDFDEPDDGQVAEEGLQVPTDEGSQEGAYARNPLLKGLIRPLWNPETDTSDD